MPYAGISDISPLVVEHFIQGQNNFFIGGVDVFQPKTLKDAIHQAILAEKNVILGHGGFVGALVELGSKGDQGVGSSRKPPSFGGNQQ